MSEEADADAGAASSITLKNIEHIRQSRGAHAEVNLRIHRPRLIIYRLITNQGSAHAQSTRSSS